jgi:hypothetical protein
MVMVGTRKKSLAGECHFFPHIVSYCIFELDGTPYDNVQLGGGRRPWLLAVAGYAPQTTTGRSNKNGIIHQ